MKIVQGFPPNILEIKKKFPITVNTVYTYGDTLYNPSGQRISDDLMAHEETHERQQNIIGIEQWWAMYLENDGFRLEQEVKAYREQWKSMQGFSRGERRFELDRISKDLASPLYGNLINKKTAKETIENYV